MSSAYASKITIASGSKTFTKSVSRSVAGTSTTDLFAMTTDTTSTTFNGDTTHVFATTYNKSANTWTSSTPVGRQTVTTLDSLERPTNVQIVGTSPVQISAVQTAYDGQGRVSSITQGARTYTINYDATTGWVSSLVDNALSRTTTFDGRDAVGRVTQETLPGSRTVLFGYDANGNLMSLTPPGQPVHGFTSNAFDLTDTYAPPDLGFTPKDTTYTYNTDRQLTRESQPG